MSSQVTVMSPVDIAWVAGLLEGEGFVSLTRQRKNTRWKLYPRIQVQMTDEDVVRRLHEVAGEGRLNGPYYPSGITKDGTSRSPVWTWFVTDRRGVARILLAIYPLMGQRRQRTIAEAADLLLRPFRTRSLTEPTDTGACGQYAGVKRHYKAGQNLCPDCRRAHYEYHRNYKLKRQLYAVREVS